MTHHTHTPVRLDSGAHRSIGVAYVLWLLLGPFGAHRFYLRRPGTGVIYLLTAGVFLLGWLADGFRLPTIVRRVNAIGF